VVLTRAPSSHSLGCVRQDRHGGQPLQQENSSKNDSPQRRHGA
jgi:hypothetical protein